MLILLGILLYLAIGYAIAQAFEVVDWIELVYCLLLWPVVLCFLIFAPLY